MSITKEQLSVAKEAATPSEAKLTAWVDNAKRQYEKGEAVVKTLPNEFLDEFQAKILDGYRVCHEYWPTIQPGFYQARLLKPEAVQAQELEQVVITATAAYYDAVDRDKDAYARLSAEYVVQEAGRKAAAAEEARKAKLYEESFKKALAELQENV